MIEEKEHILLKDKYSKVIFNDKECKDYLIVLLSKILGIDEKIFLDNFEIKSTELEYDRTTKRSIIDALYETNENIINVEINFNKSDITDRKNYRYLCQIISRQVRIGDEENYFKEAIQININNYDYLKKGEFVYKSVMMEEKYHIKRDNYSRIYDISLEYLKGKEYNQIQEEERHSLERLLYIFVCDNVNTRDKLYKGDELMKKVNDKLTNLCGGKTEDLYWTKEEYEEYKKAVFKDVAFHKGIEQGEQKGIEKRNKEIAKSMLEENESIEKIIKYTGLSEKEIEEL